MLSITDNAVSINKLKVADFLSSDDFKPIFNKALNTTAFVKGDRYAYCMLKVLQDVFPSVTWILNSSQKPFDIYSLEARIAIEVKTYKHKLNGISKPTTLLSNATIYPDTVKYKDVAKKSNIIDEAQGELFLDTLVVVLEKNATTVMGLISDVAVVDGSYWNVSYDDYKDCADFFRLMNDNKRDILALLQDKNPSNKFIAKLRESSDIEFSLRKLITIKNPLC